MVGKLLKLLHLHTVQSPQLDACIFVLQFSFSQVVSVVENYVHLFVVDGQFRRGAHIHVVYSYCIAIQLVETVVDTASNVANQFGGT